MQEIAVNVIKIFSLGIAGFLLAFLLTPFFSRLFSKHRLWRKEVRTKSIDGKDLSVFQKFHSEGETNVPRLGGLLIWMTTLILIFLFFGVSKITELPWLQKLNFLSREQTWLPLFALITSSLLGLADDLLQVFSRPSNAFLQKIWDGKGKYVGGGLSIKSRLIIMAAIGLAGAWWFYYKLGWHTIHIPGVGNWEIGILYIPLFVLVMLAVYSGGVIDGIDGLAGGAFASMFGAYAGIALVLGQVNIAAFCTVILGALLAFLWFNIPPARFYMGETGMMGLCATLTVVAFLTDSVLVLPVIGFLLVIESGSVTIQLLSKKFRNKKVFLASPIHHHFEAKGWPHYKVTMRFWIIGAVSAILGIAVRLLG